MAGGLSRGRSWSWRWYHVMPVARPAMENFEPVRCDLRLFQTAAACRREVLGEELS